MADKLTPNPGLPEAISKPLFSVPLSAAKRLKYLNRRDYSLRWAQNGNFVVFEVLK
jgi:hypothetical protein